MTKRSRCEHLVTRFTKVAGVVHPIMQDGLGPFSTVEIAVAVSNAGGLGSVSVPGLFVEERVGVAALRSHIDTVASRTSGPFAVYVPVGVDYSGQVLPMSLAYMDAVIHAVKDREVASRLAVLTTSGGPPDRFALAVKDAGWFMSTSLGVRSKPAAQNGRVST